MVRGETRQGVSIDLINVSCPTLMGRPPFTVCSAQRRSKPVKTTIETIG